MVDMSALSNMPRVPSCSGQLMVTTSARLFRQPAPLPEQP